ncbi:MAG: magnesium transporter CorA family protein [Deinococcales bacterium]
MTTPSKHPVLHACPGIRVKCLEQCSQLPLERTKRVWIDAESPSPEDISKLQALFRLNPLALEDALEKGHWSKFEAYVEHLFLIFRTLAEPEDVTDRTERISVFWFPEVDTLLTIRNEPVTYLESVWSELNTRQNLHVADVLFALLDRGTDTFFTFLDELETRTDELEERVFAPNQKQDHGFFSEVFELKHTMIHARRLVSSAREAIAQCSRYVSTTEPNTAMYLRDVGDHLTRSYDGLDSSRDVLSSLLDVHLSVQGNRMNEVMKTLTTMSSIFLPLTFLAGVWGMNYKLMPELEEPWGYAFAWAMFILSGLGFAAYFKWRKWW